jgi:hypothetical protein
MITGWRQSPCHNLLHTEGHPTLLRANALYIERPVSMLSQASSPPFILYIHTLGKVPSK